MFNLDGLIPKLCLLAQEMGEDGRAHHLRSAGLQTLSSVVIFYDYWRFLPKTYCFLIDLLWTDSNISASFPVTISRYHFFQHWIL